MVAGKPLKCVALPKIDTKTPTLDKLRETIAQLRASAAAIEAAPLTVDIARQRVADCFPGLEAARIARREPRPLRPGLLFWLTWSRSA